MDKDFSDKLMALTQMLQGCSEEKKKLFGDLFQVAHKMSEEGFTNEEIQITCFMAFQCHANPDLKKMYDLLIGQITINPDAEYQ